MKKKQITFTVIFVMIALIIVSIELYAIGMTDYITIMLPSFFLFILSLSLFLSIPYCLGIINAHKSKLSKIDLKKEEQYYREIIKQYSPACLSYIDNFETGTETIIATILSLKLKNKIQILDNKVIVIDSDITNLSNTEINILESVQNGTVEVTNLIAFSKLAMEEALENNLIIDKKPNKKAAILFIVFIILVQAIAFIIDYLMYMKTADVMPMTFVAFISNLIFYFLFHSAYAKYASFARIRTEKGEELNKKLEGLKQYIKKFSSLDDKKSEFVNIWDEYLIYSVIFKQNKTVEKELSNIVKIDIE